jgi:hypothetical protein
MAPRAPLAELDLNEDTQVKGLLKSIVTWAFNKYKYVCAKVDKHFRVPRDKHSLLAQSLQTKLVSHGQADQARPQDNSILTHLSHKAAAQVSSNINTVIMNCFNAITNALFS